MKLSLSQISTLLEESNDLGSLLEELHKADHDSIFEGRNMLAGSARTQALQSEKVIAFIEADPVFQESMFLAVGRTIVLPAHLQNIFLIMKYGMKDIEGDIIEFGSYLGGSALFMANIARRLGLKTTIYALDTFEGMPSTDPDIDLHVPKAFDGVDLKSLERYIQRIALENLVLVKGLFQETASGVLLKTKKIILTHIDCDIYSALKYTIASVGPYMHASGGYLVLDDPLCPSCLGAFQAVEEELMMKGFRAEQSFPQLVYRMPALESVPSF